MRRPYVTGGVGPFSIREVSIALALMGYLIIVAFMVPRHEPWADEAQAWQIARSVSFLDMFGNAIHYEGSPGLWHTLLWVMVRFHVSYVGLHWFSGLIAFCGVCLAVRFAPFPLPLRLLLPFTYFMAYQYSIIARSYILLAPLLFGIAILWPRRLEHPIPVAILISLLANTCAHGIMIAFGLCCVWLLDYKQDWQESAKKRSTLLAALIVLAGIGFAVWCFLPPKDADWVNASSKVLEQPLPQIASLVPEKFSWIGHLPPAVQISVGMSARLIHVLGFGVSLPVFLILPVWILMIVRWYNERRLRYLFPIGLLTGFCMITRFDFYHAGIVWLLTLFLWWITWPEHATTDTGHRVVVALFAVFLLTQTVWAALAVRYEATHAYSPDRAAVPYLQKYLDDGKWVDLAVPPSSMGQDGEYLAVGLEPYFPTEPLHNARARYWIWRPADEMREQYLRDTQKRAVVVLLEKLGESQKSAEEEDRLTMLGYRQSASVCGQVYYPRQEYRVVCHVFFEAK